MRDEKEGRKKQARSNKQQGKATQHTQGSHVQSNSVSPWLLLAANHMSTTMHTMLQVDATYPELAELLLVVIKTLLGREPQFNIDKGNLDKCTYAHMYVHVHVCTCTCTWYV